MGEVRQTKVEKAPDMTADLVAALTALDVDLDRHAVSAEAAAMVREHIAAMRKLVGAKDE